MTPEVLRAVVLAVVRARGCTRRRAVAIVSAQTRLGLRTPLSPGERMWSRGEGRRIVEEPGGGLAPPGEG